MSQRIFPIEPVTGTCEAPAQPRTTEPAPASATPDAISSERTGPRVEEPKKPIPLIWIPIVICLGLLIAAGYLGGRIFASRPASAAVERTTASPRDPAPIPAAPAAAAPTAQASEITPVAAAVDRPASAENAEEPVLTVRTHDDPALAPPDDLSVIHPNPGDRFVQISALNTAAAHRYVDKLRHGPLEPHLAQGPTPTILRVLIGPFGDRMSLLNTMSDLKAAGIDCFIREY